MNARPHGGYRICTRCIMDTTDPEIYFDDKGVCHRCHDYNRVIRDHVFADDTGKQRWHETAQRIKAEGYGKPYDCVIGLSGGVDSSYVAWLVKNAGLRPLAVHLDNGWNTEVAVRNIENIVKILDIDLHTEVLDWEEFRSLQAAFIRASVPDCEIPTDHAIAASLYQAALRERVRFIITGGNFVTELMVPSSWSEGQTDWKYIKHINRKFGTKSLRTFPHYRYWHKTIYYPGIKKLELISPLNWIEYNKFEAIEFMQKELGWASYGGKHHESVYTRFYQGYILPRKFAADKRRPHLSCLINDGRITRDYALREIQQPPLDEEIVQRDKIFVIKKLGFSEVEFEDIMNELPKKFVDFPSDTRDAPRYYELARTGVRFAFVARNFGVRAVRSALYLVLYRVLYRLRAAVANFVLRPISQILVLLRLCHRVLRDDTRPTIPPAQPVGSRQIPHPTALIISLTPIFDEPRVRRQAATLTTLGWHVNLAGFEGRSELRDGWTWIPLDKDQAAVGSGLSKLRSLSPVSSGFTEAIYWAGPGNNYMLEQLIGVHCDLVIAHDYPTVPLAATIAEFHRVDYVVDCHEYARAQIPLKSLKMRLRWMLLERAYLDAINRRFLPRARAVSTVCDGIADLLQRDYRLSARPSVLRSVPEYKAYPFRSCGKTIWVLYHGNAVPSRGMEQAIDSVASWRPEFKLRLRLVATDEYCESLKERAARNGVADRIEFLEPVPFTDLVNRAADADIGYCVLEDYSPQRRFTAPNKFFEYAMAGLAVVCSDLPELRKIGDQYGHCVFVDRFDPVVIAECINGLSPEIIDDLKEKALVAARELCWENEQRKMITAYLDSGATAKP